MMINSLSLLHVQQLDNFTFIVVVLLYLEALSLHDPQSLLSPRRTYILWTMFVLLS